ncbi:MAG: hypothetical protein H5T86_02960 [Armatimonadetes bacterium]|nr:hypothetical protein [Armatimonadota bacterium]
MAGPVPFAHAYGRPEQIGQQIGQQLGEEIRALLRALGIPERYSTPQHSNRLDKVMSNLENQAPQLVEEMSGIARGAAVSERDIHMLNCITELAAVSCSIIAFSDAPGGPVIGRTFDSPAGHPSAYAIVAIDHAGGSQILAATWPGTVWVAAGVNGRGLALATASVRTGEYNEEGIPAGMVSRLVLEQAPSASRAVELLAEIPMTMHPFNAAVADEGQALLGERSVYKVSVREPEAGTLCATNHFRNPDLAELCNEPEEVLGESRERLARLEELANSHPHAKEEAMHILADHGQPPICKHDSGSTTTVAACVLRPRARVMWFAAGRPCDSPFRPFQLKLPVSGGGGIVGYGT